MREKIIKIIQDTNMKNKKDYSKPTHIMTNKGLEELPIPKESIVSFQCTPEEYKRIEKKLKKLNQPQKEECICSNYGADWVDNGWKCHNCGKINPCKIGGVDVNCCPNAPHEKYVEPQPKKSWEEQLMVLFYENVPFITEEVGIYHDTIKQFIKNLLEEQKEEVAREVLRIANNQLGSSRPMSDFIKQLHRRFIIKN
jgi:hypothetical protein